MSAISGIVYSNAAAKFPSSLLPKDIKWYPVIGHLMIFDEFRSKAHDMWLKLARENDFKSFFLSFPGMSFFSAQDEADRRYILKDNWHNYQKNYNSKLGFKPVFAELLGDGIFNVDGDEWLVHRKIASKLFTGKNMSNIMSTSFQKHGEILRDALLSTKQEFDIQSMLQALVFDAFCEIALGESPNSFEKSLRGEKDAFLVAFDTAQNVTTERFYNPPIIREFKKFFSLGVEKEYHASLQIIDNFVENIIQARLCKKESTEFTDMLGLYIAEAKAKGKEKEILNLGYLRDMVINILIAGRDTTAFTLTNMIALLAENPQVEEQFVKEATARVGSPDFLSQRVNTFQLGDAVFYEALRMYPSVANDLRFCQEDDVLPSGIHIPKGTLVFINNQACGRNPLYSKSPDSFLPERWLHNGVCEKPDEYRFPFFWAGNRICLGKDMARLESKIISSILFESLKFSTSRPRIEESLVTPVMFYKHGVHLYAEPRF